MLLKAIVPPEYTLALRVLLVALVLLAVWFWGFLKGIDHEQVKLEALQRAVDRAAAVQAAHTQDIKIKQDQINEDRESDYQTRLASLRAHYDGLLHNQGHRGTVPLVPKTPSCTYVVPPDGPSVDSSEPAFTVSVSDCAASTLQLEELQSWVRQQYTVSK